MLFVSQYAPYVAVSSYPSISLTLTYHVLPVSSPLIFHCDACRFVTMYVDGASVDSQASS